MPAITITKTYQDGDILTEADLDAIRTDIITFLNTTKIDATNIQASSITTALLQNSAVTTDKINNSAVTTDKLAASAVTAAKLAVLARGVTGEVKMFHTFNGTLSVPRGWMICNGDQVVEAAYNAIHGAGAYAADGIASSTILNKHLPNATSKYPVGVVATTQSGASAITYVGNTSNQINIQHNHSHNHRWYLKDAGGDDETYNASGTAVDLTEGSAGSALDAAIAIVGKDQVHLDANAYTDDDATSALSATQSIQPHSFEVIYIMKVI